MGHWAASVKSEFLPWMSLAYLHKSTQCPSDGRGARAKVTVSVGSARVTIRTRSDGKFTATVRASVRKNAAVKVAAAADPRSYSATAETAKAR